MTKPIIVVKVPCKLLYVIQVKEFLIKCSTSWPYLISEFLVAYITIVAVRNSYLRRANIQLTGSMNESRKD